MIIREVAIGNKTEAFIENRFEDRINIIFSNDNNKGKTILVQSLLYALGNEPIFPTTFPYKDYYHISTIEVNEKIYCICRKNNSFIIEHDGYNSVFENVSEFKYYINKNIFALPRIIKNNSEKLVDPVLFYQLFFVGQDNKDTSNIIHSSYYKKEDFIMMLYAIYGLEINEEIENKDELKDELDSLKNEKKQILTKNKILKSSSSTMNFASLYKNRERYKKTLAEIEQINDSIIELSKVRNTLTNRKMKNEATLKELRSLNRTLNIGELRCMDCNSTKINYAASDNSYSFDVSNNIIRNQIIDTINDKILAYNEEIDKTTSEISTMQQKLNDVLSVEDFDIEGLIIYRDEIVSSFDADKRLMDIHDRLDEIDAVLKTNEKMITENKDKKKELINSILAEMTIFYKHIDNEGNLVFEDIFTKKNDVFSGSESTEFYLSRLYSFTKVLNHEFPIIMDSFRDEELSTKKEALVLEKFKELNNQVIFTATIKEEEENKYSSYYDLNIIDYSSHKNSKLLVTNYVDEFITICSKLSIEI